MPGKLSNAIQKLTADALAVYQAVLANPGASAPTIIKSLSTAISQPTFSRRVEAIEAAGLIRREGETRSTRYFAISPLDYLQTPPEKRSPVGYQFDWLQAYTPNAPESSVFSSAELAKMHVAGVITNMRPDIFFHRTFERFLIDLSYSSSKMEGNTYTLLDTEKLIKEGQEAEGKPREDAIMILNHKAAIQYLIEHCGEIEINAREIRNVHALLSLALVQPEDSGRLRSKIVEITKTAYTPLTTLQQIEEQFGLLIEKARAIKEPFEQSVFLMATLSYLQPFIDVNKRTGRLAANIPLLKNNLCPMSYRDMNTDQYLAGLLIFYETQDTDALKDAYVDGYLKSAGRMKIYAEEAMRQPDRIDVAYRRGINMVVREIVRKTNEGAIAEPIEVINRLTAGLPEPDRAPVADRINEILNGITPDGAIAYELFPDEVEKYKSTGKDDDLQPKPSVPRP